MRVRNAVVGIGLVVTAGCGLTVSSGTSPGAAPTTTVARLPFTFVGPVMDSICPDALGTPMDGLQPPSDDTPANPIT